MLQDIPKATQKYCLCTKTFMVAMADVDHQRIAEMTVLMTLSEFLSLFLEICN